MVQRAVLFVLLLPALIGGSAWTVEEQVPSAGQYAPEITGGAWINSQPLTMSGLRGRVVMVEFWTYG